MRENKKEWNVLKRKHNLLSRKTTEKDEWLASLFVGLCSPLAH